MPLEKITAQHPHIRGTLEHSLKDGIAFSVMAGGGESYFSAFAILLQATTAQVGTLVTLPPLIASFFQLVSAWIGRRLKSRKVIIIGGALMQAAALVPLILLPLVFPEHAFLVLLACITLYFIGPNLGAPQWGSLMGDIVPEAHRGKYFALRTRLSSIASFSALIGAGLTLQVFDDVGLPYYGFVTIFALASVARLISTWHLYKMVEPERPEHERVKAKAMTRLIPFLRSPFLRFSMFFASMQFGVAISGPYIVVHMLRDLDFSYAALTFNSAASVFMQFVMLNRWGRLSDLFGNRLIMVVTGFTIPFIPSLWILSTNYVYLCLVQVLSGLVWSGFTLSAANLVFDLTHPQKRARYMAIHNTIAATAVFLGATTGGYLALHLPTSFSIGGFALHWPYALYGVFFIASVVRFTVAASFLPRIREPRRVRRMTANGLIFRAVRFSNVSGLTFDPILRFRSGRRDRDTGSGTS